MSKSWIFLTMDVLENTPAVLSTGKHYDENGYPYEWMNGPKPHLIKNGIRLQCNTENFVFIVVPGLSTSSSSGSHHFTSTTLQRQERYVLHLVQARFLHQRQQHQVIVRLENERGSNRSETSPVLVSSLMLVTERGHPVVGRESDLEPVHQANKKFSPKINYYKETMI